MGLAAEVIRVLRSLRGRPARGLVLVALVVLVGASWMGCNGASPPALEPGLAAARDGVEAEAIARHVRYLADDALQGRGTGTHGFDLAAQYVAERFAELGLQPAGDVAGFLQHVPLVRADLIAEGTSVKRRKGDAVRALALGADVLIEPDFSRELAALIAPVAFVGYGVSAPQIDYDDYAGIDVGGKVVVWLQGAPASLPNNERAHHASNWVKRQAAADRGAVGVLTLLRPKDHQRMSWRRRVEQAEQGSMRWIEADGSANDVVDELFVRGTLSESGALALFEGASRSLEQVFQAAEASRPQAFDLGGEIEVATASRQTPVRSANVLARLPGSDRALAAEQVVLTAHLDHLGVDAAVDGDAIYNGAYDNASGVAVLLEVARGMLALPEAPRRSVVFAAVTGEERGLLGSDYLAQHGDKTLGTVVANLNLDMVMMQGPLSQVVGFGIEHSSLSDAVRLATAQLGLTLLPDPFPDEVVFTRGDQYSFVQRGIPALMLAPAPGAGFGDWIGLVYHSPAHDLSQSMDFQAGADFARLNLLVAWHVADSEKRPTWNSGDYFGDLFGR